MIRQGSGSRLTSIDALRGLVMVIMALDHTRDLIHRGAILFSATDLSKTTWIIFLTRWITHFCLPVFMFTAGTGIFLWWHKGGRSRNELSRFLVTRGLWFVSLELTVMQLAYDFNLPTRFIIFLLVLWIFGLCMVGMSVLIRMPIGSLVAVSIAVIVFHNCLDGIDGTRAFGSGAWLWNILRQSGLLRVAGIPVLVSYTVIPWLAVMAAGFCFGEVLLMDPARRQRTTRNLGLAMFAAFLALRAFNHYGDQAPWIHGRSAIFTLLSFLNTTKYPASLDFLLMTLGPALILLAYLDRHPPKPTNPLVTFGRVPLFYFVLHFYLIHMVVLLLSFVRYGGHTVAFAFNPVPNMGGSAQLYPKDFGWSLTTVYLAWIGVVAALYPVCRWFAKIKAERRSWWLSYL